MPKLVVALLLMSTCVFIHAFGLVVALRWLKRRPVPDIARATLRVVAWLIGVAAWVILLHLAQILVWAAAYLGYEVMPDLQTPPISVP